MKNSFRILFSSTDKKEINEINEALKKIDEIEDVHSVATRSLDPNTILIWVQLISGVLGTIGVALPLFQKIIETINKKGIKGTTLKLANGTEIILDNASPEDIKRILEQYQ